jgi:hypothetical protein
MSLIKNRIFYNLNMSFFDFKNLFDYKLLLILGLAIILLYIYYEIEYINYKIDLLSDSIYALKNKNVQSESIPKESISNKISPKESISNEIIPKESIPKGSIQSESVQSESVQSESVQSESIQSESVQSESIPKESIPKESIPKKSNEIQLKKMVIVESNSLESNSLESNSNQKKDSDDYSDKIINIDITGINTDRMVESHALSEIIAPKHIEVYSNSSPKEKVSSLKEKVSLQKYDELDLKKLNLPELKNIAEKLMINTTKMVGDKSKMKTKSELIKEIVEK